MTDFPAIATAYYFKTINDLPITDAEHRTVEYWCADNDLTISEMLDGIQASLSEVA
jgi:membrane-bound inhibitor of C-type lysozyme